MKDRTQLHNLRRVVESIDLRLEPDGRISFDPTELVAISVALTSGPWWMAEEEVPRAFNQALAAGSIPLDGLLRKLHVLPARQRRKPVPPGVREQVFDRDGHRCLRCGSPDNLTIDHIKPVSDGGSNAKRNLQTLCQSCNSTKGTKTERHA